VVGFLNEFIHNKGEKTDSCLTMRVIYLNYINYVYAIHYPSSICQINFACKRTNCRKLAKFRRNGLDTRSSSIWRVRCGSYQMFTDYKAASDPVSNRFCILLSQCSVLLWQQD